MSLKEDIAALREMVAHISDLPMDARAHAITRVLDALEDAVFSLEAVRRCDNSTGPCKECKTLAREFLRKYTGEKS